jgi:hypothetical protein
MIPTFSPAVDIVQPEQWLFLLGVCLPLTGLWAYALLRCLRDARAGEESQRHPLALGPDALDPMTWALLIVLTGWFGALAYLFSVVMPGLMQRLQVMPELVRKIHAPVP